MKHEDYVNSSSILPGLVAMRDVVLVLLPAAVKAAENYVESIFIFCRNSHLLKLGY